MAQSIGPALRSKWRMLSAVPGGKWLFSRVLGIFVPYSGTLGANISILEPGHSRILLRERRKVRNHLHSVHAIALCNLGEMATGLALLNSLPDGTRGILTGISAEYLKKARGQLVAECFCDIPRDSNRQEVEVSGEIRDREGDLVARVQARWLTGPEKVADHAD